MLSSVFYSNRLDCNSNRDSLGFCIATTERLNRLWRRTGTQFTLMPDMRIR